jgi:predicted transglutaminase-like cysteine proteinase
LIRRVILFALAVSLLQVFVLASSATASGLPAFMPVAGDTSQPIGHYEFCQRLPEECGLRVRDTGGVTLTEPLWQQLLQINTLVNSAIHPATDQDLFGRAEVWFFPGTSGDCEDYVLLKRRMLAEAGWPLSALLITVVRKPDGEGHAVLTVRTDRGDFILDNLEASIRLWSEVPYTFVKRQAATDTGRWVAIEDSGRAGAVAAVR